MPYVNQRWLGGLLTNFQTINKRIKRLHELTELDRERHARAAAHARADLGDQGARQARGEPRRGAQHAAAAGCRVHLRHEDRGDRRARGRSAEDPDHRARRHQLRPGPGELRHSRQRRRDPLLQARGRRDRRRGGRARQGLPRRGGEGACGGRGEGSGGRGPGGCPRRRRGAAPARGRGGERSNGRRRARRRPRPPPATSPRPRG